MSALISLDDVLINLALLAGRPVVSSRPLFPVFLLDYI
jgi:hypothetical protein